MAKQTLDKTAGASLGVLSCLAALLTVAAPLGAQPTLQITSPASGVTVAPGQVLTISVSASGSLPGGVGVIGTYPFPSAGAIYAPPYQFSVTLPADLPPATYGITAWGGLGPGQGMVNSATLPVNVVISPPATALTADPSILDFGFVGDQTPLQVIGTFSSGQVIQVTDSPDTTYASASTSVATVTSYGMVTATGPGSTNIIVNGTLFVPVSVPQPVSVMPPISILYASQTEQFVATVATSPLPGSVTWSASPSGLGTFVSGLYTAPASIPSQQVITITATNAANSAQTASVSLLLYPPVSASVAPASVTLGQSQTQQFAATVYNVASGNVAVMWSISPRGVGTVNGTGLYTAPATIASTQTVLLTATSVDNGRVAASASITLTPPQ
jgi:hypothetical protein